MCTVLVEVGTNQERAGAFGAMPVVRLGLQGKGVFDRVTAAQGIKAHAGHVAIDGALFGWCFCLAVDESGIGGIFQINRGYR